MKLLLLLALFGLAAATTFQSAWEKERDNVVFHFMKGMKMAGPLRNALGMPDAHEVDYAEDKIKTELGKHLKEQLDKVLEKIKGILDRKEEIKEGLLEKVKELREKLKDLHVKISDKAKELIEKLKDKFRDYLKDLIERITGKETRAIDQAMEAAENGLNLKEILRKVKEMIKEHLDVEKIKEYIEKFHNKLGELGRMLLEKLKDKKGLEALRKLIRNLIGEEERETRDLKEYWEKLKEFFKEKHLQFKEKFSQFAEWLKEAIKNGLQVAKDKTKAMKDIAREIIDHSKQISKEVAMEALEALKPYHEDLGGLWNQLKDTVNEILHRKD